MLELKNITKIYATDDFKQTALDNVSIVFRKCEFVSIHRLVAEEYIPNPNNYPIVNHLDGDKQNNHYTNLEWCTQKDNIIHSWKNGFSKPRRNEKVKMSKRIDQLTLEGEYITTFPSTMEIERQLGIPHSQISNVCKNRKELPFGWWF